MTEGPAVRSQDGLIDLTQFAQRFGLQGQVLAEQNLWRNLCRNDAESMALINSLVEGMDKMLSSERADYDNFDFKHWYRKSERSTKADWTRVRATMYMNEESQPWVHLTESPKRAHRWRGRSHA
jgi:hypothetical protein